jgi:protein required for attachment to host cells
MSYRHSARRVPIVWILVADRAAARILAADWPTLENVRELDDCVNPPGGMQGHELYADRFGQDHAPDGHGFTDSPTTDFRHHTAEHFAQHLTQLLEDARNRHEFGTLVVIAPPLMLGALRGHFSAALKKLIATELHKELLHSAPAEIVEYVQQSLQKPAAV